MAANSSPQQTNDSQATYRLFIRYSNITFFVIMGFMLIVSTGLLFLMVTDPHKPTDNDSQLIKSSFDEATIEKVKGLTSDTNPTPPKLPEGRINPFVE